MVDTRRVTGTLEVFGNAAMELSARCGGLNLGIARASPRVSIFFFSKIIKSYKKPKPKTMRAPD